MITFFEDHRDFIIIAYCAGFALSFAMSVKIEKKSPYPGATMLHLLWVSFLWAAFWPFWFFGLVLVSVFSKLLGPKR